DRPDQLGPGLDDPALRERRVAQHPAADLRPRLVHRHPGAPPGERAGRQAPAEPTTHGGHLHPPGLVHALSACPPGRHDVNVPTTVHPGPPKLSRTASSFASAEPWSPSLPPEAARSSPSVADRSGSSAASAAAASRVSGPSMSAEPSRTSA